MVKYIFWTIVIYFLIRFVFNFVIPVFRATRQMRSQVKDFQSRMQEEQQKQQSFQNNAGTTAPQEKSRSKSEEYIDFEEIK